MGVVLSRAAFDEQRREICRSGSPSDGDDLLGMEIDFLARLGDPTYADQPHELWEEPTVEQDQGGDWLIRLSTTARPGVTAEQVVEGLSAAWTQDLRYHYREAHTLVTEPRSVTLQAVTQMGPNDLWATAHVRVELIR
ncbi:hypothetical protein [Kribbella monticola]|uniref:hypothetical protein n=1 Tax=Kribbella monticola TaxID=2185285 RepID=UPI000DD3F7F6|nr:hypothetical protein [Kribbella monticola]